VIMGREPVQTNLTVWFTDWWLPIQLEAERTPLSVAALLAGCRSK